MIYYFCLGWTVANLRCRSITHCKVWPKKVRSPSVFFFFFLPSAGTYLQSSFRKVLYPISLFAKVVASSISETKRENGEFTQINLFAEEKNAVAKS